MCRFFPLLMTLVALLVLITGCPDVVDGDGDGYPSQDSGGNDCDDGDPDIHPGANEICDGIDNDCDGAIDEDADDAPTWYADSDGDGFGSSEDTVVACVQPEEGYVSEDDDCDDNDATTYPGAEEICDGIDNDCDGEVPGEETDDDGDGYNECADEDCDDADDTVFPGAYDICDAKDNDCDGIVDQDWNDDGDGFTECGADGHFGNEDDDCDDQNSTVFPGADELCDGLDNDCYGGPLVDEIDADGDGDLACAECDDSDALLNLADADGDGQTSCGGDCDDGDAATYVGATEICDGIDNDCDGTLPVDEADADGDGWSLCMGDCDDNDAALNLDDDDSDGFSTCDGDCDDGDAGYYPDDLDNDGYSPCCGDCDDADADTYPGAPAICDGVVDNDCDGVVDGSFDCEDTELFGADCLTVGYGRGILTCDGSCQLDASSCEAWPFGDHDTLHIGSSYANAYVVLQPGTSHDFSEIVIEADGVLEIEAGPEGYVVIGVDGDVVIDGEIVARGGEHAGGVIEVLRPDVTGAPTVVGPSYEIVQSSGGDGGDFAANNTMWGGSSVSGNGGGGCGYPYEDGGDASTAAGGTGALGLGPDGYLNGGAGAILYCFDGDDATHYTSGNSGDSWGPGGGGGFRGRHGQIVFFQIRGSIAGSGVIDVQGEPGGNGGRGGNSDSAGGVQNGGSGGGGGAGGSGGKVFIAASGTVGLSVGSLDATGGAGGAGGAAGNGSTWPGLAGNGASDGVGGDLEILSWTTDPTPP